MKLLVAPNSLNRFEAALPEDFTEIDIDLGGVFYDYLCEPGGEIVGIRYHLMEPVNFEAHPVYRQFLNDSRFVYRSDQSVDMVAEERYAAALQHGLLSLMVVQDFGGEQVVERQNQFSIIVELHAS